MLKDDRLRPYHVKHDQKLTQSDYPHRVEFINLFPQQNAVISDVGETVLFRVECTFTRDGAFNAHNQNV